MKSWARILVCGFVTGVVWMLLGAVFVEFLGREFMAAATRGAGAPKAGALMFALTVAAGLWAMWLYSIVRPALGAGLKSAFVVALAWWLMAGLQSAKWITLQGLPGGLAVPLGIAILVAMFAAILVGSWLFERSEKAGEAKAVA